jgi:hypothetical protein
VETAWTNLIASCLIVVNEAAVDLREFLQYHKRATPCDTSQYCIRTRSSPLCIPMVFLAVLHNNGVPMITDHSYTVRERAMTRWLNPDSDR